MVWCVSHVRSRVMLRLDARTWTNLFRICSRDGRRRRLRGGGGYDPTPGDTRPTEDGKRRLIRGEGFASWVSGTVRPQDPGGGATPVAAPRRIRTDDISDTAELSRGGGGGLRWSPPEFRWCWSRRPMLGILHDRSVPGEGQRPLLLPDG